MTDKFCKKVEWERPVDYPEIEIPELQCLEAPDGVRYKACLDDRRDCVGCAFNGVAASICGKPTGIGTSDALPCEQGAVIVLGGTRHKLAQTVIWEVV